MIDYSSAKKILIKSGIKIKNETIDSLKSLNRVCASDINTSYNYPSGNNTAFDGYAINSQDTINLSENKFKKFKILKTIAAGDNPKIKKVKKFETAEVMTGALICKPFDAVIPIEEIEFNPSIKNKKFILVKKKIKKNEYIRFMGSDYKKKEIVIKQGTLIQPSHILAFKALGIKKVKVKVKPNILFFSTGSEILDKKNIKNWQVRSSNNYYIQSLSNSFLFNFVDGRIIRDKDENLFNKLIKKSIRSKVDIIITSGAVSAGKYDFVPSVINKFKLSNFFKGVAIRPGKPILFAKFKNKEKAFFGLPGNPISSAACFRFFVYPYLSNILGMKEEKPFKAKLKNKFKKKKNFTRFLKGRLTSTNNGNLVIEILQGQESFRIKSFVKSNVWAVFNKGKSIFKKDHLIDCHSPIGPNKNIFY